MTPEEIAAVEAAPLSHRMVAAATEIAEADVLDTMEQIDGALVATLLRAGAAEIERLSTAQEDRFGPRTQDGTDPRCAVEAGTDRVTYCARMAWMLDAGDRHFRVGYRVPRNAEAYGAVVIDVKDKRFSFCDYCPFCGAYIATRKPGGER